MSSRIVIAFLTYPKDARDRIRWILAKKMAPLNVCL